MKCKEVLRMDIEQAKIIPINEVLEKYGNTCPKCGHVLDIGNTNRCRCHKCNTIYSTVDLIQAFYGKYIKYKIFYEQLFAKNKHHKLTYV